MERLDTFDELGRHTGVADRLTVHAEGLWHQVIHILVVARRESGPVVVLQRRAASKSTFPGLLDLSATGHLAAGETPIDGLRELREELGIDVAPAALVRLGVRRLVDVTPEGTNRELAHVHLVADDRPLEAYAPDPTEVDAVVDLPVDAGLDLFTGRRDVVECAAVGADGATTRLTVERSSFVPDPPLGDVRLEGDAPGYWVTLLQMAGRLADGDHRLAI
ncbi:NUDIX hydrolase [Actinomarinicola tropica]|uniref:NUDIX domain-containing protein n=1 Tax=Actinomarinicola tropica TaxID=2789776 RepID=A0A5Q2RL07_9ACTN|nr:NUDIX domain-containing protein [Actinomarinicola tropica]QGG95116.1 NUDIX domain-containing protein [Actinomarinicola tropica]